MKTLLQFISAASAFFLFACSGFGQAIFINEFHYDNAGADTGEFVEVAVQSTYVGALADIEILFYNGSNGTQYDSRLLSSATEGTTEDGFTFYVSNVSGIQNGGPDGIALVVEGVVVEFISYEGSFTAVDGTANGLTSTDIGVAESGSTAVGSSLQRTGSCLDDACPTGLSWTGPAANSSGSKNESEFLPVSIFDLSVKQLDQAAVLTFSTATEENNAYFLIQRSTDGRTFETIGQLDGKGNSHQQVAYHFIDTKPGIGLNYYRLQQFDYDGTSAYFGPVAVRFGEDAGAVPVVWPIPTRDRLHIDLPESDRAWQLEVYSINGQQLVSERIQEKSLNTAFDVTALPAGSYILRWTNGIRNGQERFVKL